MDPTDRTLLFAECAELADAERCRTRLEEVFARQDAANAGLSDRIREAYERGEAYVGDYFMGSGY